MTTAIEERERIVKYTREDLEEVLRNNDMGLEDCDYLSAVTISPTVIEVQGVVQALNLPTKSLRLYIVSGGPTGYFQARGGERLVLLNEKDSVDYTRVSDLHTVPDADVYLAITAPYEGDEDFERLNEWFRDETFTDHFKED